MDSVLPLKDKYKVCSKFNKIFWSTTQVLLISDMPKKKILKIFEIDSLNLLCSIDFVVAKRVQWQKRYCYLETPVYAQVIIGK